MTRQLPYWAASDNIIYVEFPQHNPDALKDLAAEIAAYAFPTYDSVMNGYYQPPVINADEKEPV